jgi:hypothetical protein
LMAIAAPWMPFASLHASVLTLVPMFTLAPMSLCLGWANLAVAGAAGPPLPHPDLLALGLDRMPCSWDGLRRAYRAAARTAHPDVPGGSREAFLAVAAAFERLSGKLAMQAA